MNSKTDGCSTSVERTKGSGLLTVKRRGAEAVARRGLDGVSFYVL
jgi:hypothetical protein